MYTFDVPASLERMEMVREKRVILRLRMSMGLLLSGQEGRLTPGESNPILIQNGVLLLV
jgi:hypothetical protein